MKWNLQKLSAGLAGCCLLVAICQASEPVDINQADAATIAASLTGIGPVKARAIVDYRDLNGRFNSPEQLQLVEGIGASLYSKVEPFLLIGGAENPAKANSGEAKAGEAKAGQVDSTVRDEVSPEAGVKEIAKAEQKS